MMLKLILGWLKSLFHKADKNAYLKEISIFRKLDSFELYLLNNFMHHRSFKAGELLFDKDYPLEMIFFIESGEIEVLGKAHPSGRSVLKKNQWIGIMDMYHENIRSSSARAITPVEANAISRKDFVDLMDNNPHMGVKILSGICESFSDYIFQICADASSITKGNTNS